MTTGEVEPAVNVVLSLETVSQLARWAGCFPPFMESPNRLWIKPLSNPCSTTYGAGSSAEDAIEASRTNFHIEDPGTISIKVLYEYSYSIPRRGFHKFFQSDSYCPYYLL